VYGSQLQTFVFVLHVVVLQTAPRQHGWLLAPQATHWVPALSQVNGSAHHLPPLCPGQHACPSPPHATHLLLLQVLSASVHPTLGQHASPILPHGPAEHSPLLHVPLPLGHKAPLAMHTPLTGLQQPLPHQSPSQHACPGTPHWAQVPPLHAKPDWVQKSPEVPWPVGLPGQQARPDPPHALPLHRWLLQLPSWPPQVVVDATHVSPLQQRVPLQPAFWQHGWPVPPQLFTVPFSQTVDPALTS
jgi:hypothetical protein